LHSSELNKGGLTLKRDPVFENYDYQQQANSLKMTINSIVPAVSAHMRKGRQEQKEAVAEYPAKVRRQLELIIRKLEQIKQPG